MEGFLLVLMLVVHSNCEYRRLLSVKDSLDVKYSLGADKAVCIQQHLANGAPFGAKKDLIDFSHSKISALMRSSIFSLSLHLLQLHGRAI
jgi:hypothetical protein